MTPEESISATLVPPALIPIVLADTGKIPVSVSDWKEYDGAPAEPENERSERCVRHVVRRVGPVRIHALRVEATLPVEGNRPARFADGFVKIDD